MPTPGDDSRLIKYNVMVDLFQKESDRAAAILAASFLDNTLRKLLLAHFVDHSQVTERFEGDRPLSTFHLGSRLPSDSGCSQLKRSPI
jgi:hypothetical protein